MLVIILESLFNCLFYSVAIYLVLWFMEKIGKKRPANRLDRAGLAVICAAGATMVQLIAQATSML